MQSRSKESHAREAECEEIAKQDGGLIKQQYEQLGSRWSLLAERPLIIRDPVLLCVAPHSRG